MRCTEDDCMAAIVKVFAVWDRIRDAPAPWDDEGNWSLEC
jgi:hypothetical protein